MKSESKAEPRYRESEYETIQLSPRTPENGLRTLARSDVSNALNVDRPDGNSIWFTPRFAFCPGNAAVGQGKPPHRLVPESRPLPAKSAMVAPAAIAQLTLAQPKAALVAAMAACALVLLKKRTSPTWLTSIASKVCVPTLRM